MKNDCLSDSSPVNKNDVWADPAELCVRVAIPKQQMGLGITGQRKLQPDVDGQETESF